MRAVGTYFDMFNVRGILEDMRRDESRRGTEACATIVRSWDTIVRSGDGIVVIVCDTVFGTTM
jgi:hypothetical protein